MSISQRAKRPRKPLNDFGRYIRIYCTIFAIDRKSLAIQANLHQTTLTHAIYGNVYPVRKTVDKLWYTLQQLAHARGGLYPLVVTSDWRCKFYNAAGLSCDEQQREALEGLSVLQEVFGIAAT